MRRTGPPMGPRPTIPEPLMRYLRANFPQRCRREGESELAHERYAGAADLVLHLEDIFRDQQIGAPGVDDEDDV